MHLYRYALLLAGWTIVSLPTLVAQAPGGESLRPVIRAVRLDADEKIEIDGRLDEPAWLRAEPATDFKQSDPRNGDPSTETTEIRILFDRDNLYIGAQFFDSNPAGILGNQMVRDGFLSSDDRFMWVIDPMYDQRSGYFFEINPGGAMGDAQLVAAQGGNFGTAQNRAWDGIWLARVRVHDQGWAVEVEIPFRTLNFNPQNEAWGANFQRTVRRKNEESYWTGWGRNQGLMNLANSGRIEGIRDVSQGYGLDIKPYVIGTYRVVPGTSSKATYKSEGGLDFFFNLTPKLKTNVTVNTDFAQTEVDDRQVNLTRFPLFFPEKRDFFLDGAGNFDFSREPNNSMSAFFSRRIGLNTNGAPQKIDFGAKMSGHAGRFDLGLMHVRTAEERGIHGEDFSVFRPRARLFSQSYAGLIYTRRTTRGSNIPDRHTIGADFQLATSRFRGSHNLQFNGYFMKTPNEAKKGNDSSYGVQFNYPNDRWNARVGFREVQQNVDPAIGFIERTNYRRLNPVVRFGPRPKNNRWVRQVSMEASAELFTDTGATWIQRSYSFTLVDLNFQSQDSANFKILPAYEVLQSDFRIAPGILLPAGSEYQFTRYSFTFNTANRRMISGGATFTGGNFYSGRRRELVSTLNLRPRRGILATFTGTLNHVELAEGSFSTKVIRAVINTQFSPFVSISNNIQYDSVSRVLGWQSRFRWIMKPGNDIYFVWLNNWRNESNDFTILERSAAVKILYTHRF